MTLFDKVNSEGKTSKVWTYFTTSRVKGKT